MSFDEKNKQRFEKLLEEVDNIRNVYIKNELYVFNLSVGGGVRGSEDDNEDDEADALPQDEEEREEAEADKSDNEIFEEENKKRIAYINKTLLPYYRDKIRSSTGEARTGFINSLKEIKQELKELKALTKKPRYYYFGFLLYPTKNERHYKILKKIVDRGISYSLVLHYKEFYKSLKRIQRTCSPDNICWFIDDVLLMKENGEKFIDKHTGKEIRLIDPHVHVLLRWDGSVSKSTFAKAFQLEENLIKFTSNDSKFLKNEYNPLNYQVHMGRSKFKYSSTNIMDLNTDVDDDMQDREDYSVDEIVACSKWYNMLCEQVEQYECMGDSCISEFHDWLKTQKKVSRYSVRRWFCENVKYLGYMKTQKECVRPDILKLVDEHNADYSLDSFNDENIVISDLLERYKQGILIGDIRPFNASSFCDIDVWGKIKTRVENMLSAMNDRLADREREIPLCICYIQGDSGSGKTTLAKSICKSIGWSFTVSGSDRDPFQSYGGQDCIILDDFRGKDMSVGEVLKMLDNHTDSLVKARYHDKPLYYCKCIIITSTVTIDDFWHDLNEHSAYREAKHQLERRIAYVASPSPDNSKFIVCNHISNTVFEIDNPALRYLECVTENKYIDVLEKMQGYKIIEKVL